MKIVKAKKDFNEKKQLMFWIRTIDKSYKNNKRLFSVNSLS